MLDLDASAFTLTPNGGASASGYFGGRDAVAGISSPGRGAGAGTASVLRINDSRWKFQDEAQLPKPREFVGGPKRYRAGRGSTVPLDLGAFE